MQRRVKSPCDRPGTEDYHQNGCENHPTIENVYEEFEAVPALTSLLWEAEPADVLQLVSSKAEPALTSLCGKQSLRRKHI